MMQQTHSPHLQAFLDYQQFEKRCSPNTFIAYQNDLEQFFAYLASQYDSISIKEITPQIIKSWLAELKEDGREARSINRKISALKSFFKFLLKQSILTATPMINIISPKSGKQLPAFFKQSELDTLFEHVEFEDTQQGKTERLVLLLFYSTGMRLSELINLKRTQVDAGYSQLKFFGKGNKERIVPVSKQMIKKLQNYMAENSLQPGNEFVFVNEKGKQLYAKQVYNFVKKILQKSLRRKRKARIF